MTLAQGRFAKKPDKIAQIGIAQFCDFIRCYLKHIHPGEGELLRL